MKNLLLVLAITFAFNLNAQFVTRAYEAQQMELKAETLFFGLIKALTPTYWRGGPDDVQMMKEGDLNIPMIEFGFVLVTDTSGSYYNYTAVETSYTVRMMMFDKSESSKVKAFFKKYLEDQQITYFETSTTISCMMIDSEQGLSAEDKKNYKKLVGALRGFFKEYHDQM